MKDIRLEIRLSSVKLTRKWTFHLSPGSLLHKGNNVTYNYKYLAFGPDLGHYFEKLKNEKAYTHCAE